MGLFGTLATATQSLQVFQAGITVAGQNISNAGTPGYIREELVLDTNRAYNQGTLIFGTGAGIQGIQQQIDLFLEARIHTASSDFSAANAQNLIFQQLESEIRELGDADLSTSLNNFLSAINETVNQPESAALRSLAIGAGQQLATDINDLRVRIDSLRSAQTVNVDTLIEEANQLIDTIEQLNPQIARLEAAGLLKSDAGALRTQRYEALNRLSEIIPVNFQERPDGSIDVFSGSDYLILTGQKQHLEAVSSGDRNVTIQDVQLSVTKSPISSAGGELHGVIQGRDQVLGGFVDQLDQYASALIFEFNRIHSGGQGLDGLTAVTSDYAVTDTTAALNAAGLTFSPEHGSFQLKVTNSQSGITETTEIAIDLDGIGTDTTLETLRDDLNAVAEITASITPDGHLEISVATGFEFSFGEDTSGSLAALGINTFFTGTDSDTIGVNSLITNNQNLFASGKGGGPGDNTNLVALAQIAQEPLDSLGGLSLDDFYSQTITDIANASASESAISSGLGAFRDSLLNQRSQFSGVSLDEEAVKVLEFQRSYQAAARIISTIDELFTTLLNI